MKKQEKREQAMNNLLEKIKEKAQEKSITQDSVQRLNMLSFMYGCGRRNDMQAVAVMTYICITEKLLDINEITNILEGDF